MTCDERGPQPIALNWYTRMMVDDSGQRYGALHRAEHTSAAGVRYELKIALVNEVDNGARWSIGPGDIGGGYVPSVEQAKAVIASVLGAIAASRGGLVRHWAPYAIARRVEHHGWQRVSGARIGRDEADDLCRAGRGAAVTVRHTGENGEVVETRCYKPFERRQQPVPGFVEPKKSAAE